MGLLVAMPVAIAVVADEPGVPGGSAARGGLDDFAGVFGGFGVAVGVFGFGVAVGAFGFGLVVEVFGFGVAVGGFGVGVAADVFGFGVAADVFGFGAAVEVFGFGVAGEVFAAALDLEVAGVVAGVEADFGAGFGAADLSGAGVGAGELLAGPAARDVLAVAGLAEPFAGLTVCWVVPPDTTLRDADGGA